MDILFGILYNLNMMRKIKYYVNKNGNYPVKDWINKFNPKLRAKILKNLFLLKSFGLKLRKPLVYPVQNEIYELRTKDQRRKVKVIRFAKINGEILLLQGLLEKSANEGSIESISICNNRLNTHLTLHSSIDNHKERRKKKKRKKKKKSDHITKHLKEQLSDEIFSNYWNESIRHRLVLSKAVIKLRLDNKLSRKEFAEAVGTNQAEISRIENGTTNTAIDILGRIANAFSKEIKFLFK